MLFINLSSHITKEEHEISSLNVISLFSILSTVLSVGSIENRLKLKRILYFESRRVDTTISNSQCSAAHSKIVCRLCRDSERERETNTHTKSWENLLIEVCSECFFCVFHMIWLDALWIIFFTLKLFPKGFALVANLSHSYYSPLYWWFTINLIISLIINKFIKLWWEICFLITFFFAEAEISILLDNSALHKQHTRSSKETIEFCYHNYKCCSHIFIFFFFVGVEKNLRSHIKISQSLYMKFSVRSFDFSSRFLILEFLYTFNVTIWNAIVSLLTNFCAKTPMRFLKF
jgi:hypothetical protein